MFGSYPHLLLKVQILQIGRKKINSSYLDDIGLAYHIYKHIP